MSSGRREFAAVAVLALLLTLRPAPTVPCLDSRVARKIPGEGSWPRAFVDHQDGNTRLNPLAPAGMEDICFGSSVLIGPAAPVTRAYADAAEVRVTPEPLAVDLTYRAGGSAHVALAVDRTAATAVVDGHDQVGAQTPFATFRSMDVAAAPARRERVLVGVDAGVLAGVPPFVPGHRAVHPLGGLLDDIGDVQAGRLSQVLAELLEER